MTPKRLAAGLIASAALTAGLLMPAGASANTHCAGYSTLDAENLDLNQLVYHFYCANAIKGYSIQSDELLTAFGTEPEGSGAGGGAPSFAGFAFQCEGELPAKSFVCNGPGAGGYDRISSTVATAGSPCDLESPLTLYVVDKFNQLRGPYPLVGPAGCKDIAAAHRRFHRALDRAELLFRDGVVRPYKMINAQAAASSNTRKRAYAKAGGRALQAATLLTTAIAGVKADTNYTDLSEAAGKFQAKLKALGDKLKAGTGTGADVASANGTLKALRKARAVPPGGIFG